MLDESWVSHYIVPCHGGSNCKHCKAGEPRPQQHTFSKLVHEHETYSPKNPSLSTSKIEPTNVKYETHLQRQNFTGTTFGNLDPVPFDPSVDPEPYACFICWSLLHMSMHCQESAKHIYCINCGRKNVEVQDCPRCARAYREYRERNGEKDTRQYGKVLQKARRNLQEENLHDGDAELLSPGKQNSDNRFVGVDRHCQFAKLEMEVKQEDELDNDGWSEIETNVRTNVHENCEMREQIKREHEVWSDDDEKCHKQDFSPTAFKVKTASFAASSDNQNVSLSSTPFVSQCSDDYFDSYSDFHNADSNKLFTYLRNQKIQDQLELDRIRSEAASKYFSESEYYFVDDEGEEENYDDYIVDEDEKSESLYSEDYAIRFFVDLLDALKHLSIDVQSTAVLNFISARKKQVCMQRDMAQKGS